MRATPILPDWVRSFKDASGQYTNIYERCPDETRLYGTESLFADWDGQVLLLAKDFAPDDLIRRRLSGEATRRFDPVCTTCNRSEALRERDIRPYRHSCWMCDRSEMGTRTNKRLHQLVERLGSPPMLYGSVRVGLLRNDGELSGSLPKCRRVDKYCESVLEFVIEQMANLRAILCLGTDASRGVDRLLRCEHGDAEAQVRDGRTVRIVRAKHPSRASNVELARTSARLAEALGHAR